MGAGFHVFAESYVQSRPGTESAGLRTEPGLPLGRANKVTCRVGWGLLPYSPGPNAHLGVYFNENHAPRSFARIGVLRSRARSHDRGRFAVKFRHLSAVRTGKS